MILFTLFQMQRVMDKFETQAENLDVQASAMDQGMGAASTLSTPADQVVLPNHLEHII